MKKSIKSVIAWILISSMLFIPFGNASYASDNDLEQNEIQSSDIEDSLDNANSVGIEKEGDGASPEEFQQAQRLFSKLSTNLSKVQMQTEQTILDRHQSHVSTNIERYTVLVLDTSSKSHFLNNNNQIIYTADTAVEYVKEAANKFIADIYNAKGTNHIAIIEYKENTARVVSPFSTNLEKLSLAINGLYDSSDTRNIAAGLQKAEELLDGVSDASAIKNVVLFTTGMTNDGDYNYNGHYNKNTIGSNWRRTDTEVKLYAYANCAYKAVESLKRKATIYSVGLFQTLKDMPDYGLEVVQFFKLCALEFATSSNYFYDVKNPENLEFVFGEIAEDLSKQPIDFYYSSGATKDYKASCHYTDRYFYEDSCGKGQMDGYNRSLSTASLCLALSAFGSNEGGNSNYSHKYKNVEKFLDDLQFNDFDKNDWFEKKPQSDSIGVAVASKPLINNNETYTLIAVAIRGGGYESEWAGNFTVGKEGQHYGFSEAKNKVLKFLKSYIKKNKINGNIKIWLTGYSRAAATANLVAGAINDNKTMFGDNVVCEKKDLYAYCFETPMGAQKSEITNQLKYNNIYNIINKNDPVTKVAMSALGFRRFGGDYFLPEKITDGRNYIDKQEAMLQFYNKMDSKNEVGKYTVDDFKMKKIVLQYILPGGEELVQNDNHNNSIQAEYLDTTINKLTTEQIKTRDNYVNELQNGIRTIFTAIYGTLFPDQPLQRSDHFLELLLDKLGSEKNLGKIVVAVFSSSSEENVQGIIDDIVGEALNEAGINNYNPSVLVDFVKAIAKLAVNFAVTHPNLTVTLFANFNSLKEAHYPELCLAWLMSQDKNYSSSSVLYDGGGNYRIIHINCPIDVEVYDSMNNLQASIKNDIPQEVKKSSIVSSINEDGEKLIYLPANEDYTVKLSATEDGDMYYSINEYSSTEGDITRIVNYSDITVQKNDILNAEVPAYEGNEQNNETLYSTTNYRLMLSDKTVIEPDKDLTGNKAKAASYIITVKADNEDYGLVLGQGIRDQGSFAQIEAVAKDGYEFAGWYENNSLVSKDAIYRFCVEKDTVLIAHFKQEKELEESFGQENNKIKKINITGISKKIAAGKKVKLTATVIPKNATNQKLSWSSSNKKYITVNKNGKISVKKAGIGKTAIITAKACDGSRVKTKYKIQIMKNAVKSIKLKVSSKSIKAGKSLKIKAKVFTTGKKSNKKLKWSSSNKKYATVSNSGKVKTKKAGKGKYVIIYAKSTDGSNIKAKIKIKLK